MFVKRRKKNRFLLFEETKTIAKNQRGKNAQITVKTVLCSMIMFDSIDVV
jgi:hypothetical protein